MYEQVPANCMYIHVNVFHTCTRIHKCLPYKTRAPIKHGNTQERHATEPRQRLHDKHIESKNQNASTIQGPQVTQAYTSIFWQAHTSLDRHTQAYTAHTSTHNYIRRGNIDTWLSSKIIHAQRDKNMRKIKTHENRRESIDLRVVPMATWSSISLNIACAFSICT